MGGGPGQWDGGCWTRNVGAGAGAGAGAGESMGRGQASDQSPHPSAASGCCGAHIYIRSHLQRSDPSPSSPPRPLPRLPPGLGNSAGYANAVALLECYVPVTGFINGVFGAVAGGACMVGPVLVAMMAKYTSLR